VGKFLQKTNVAASTDPVDVFTLTLDNLYISSLTPSKKPRRVSKSNLFILYKHPSI
jgi:hypothetical protein